MTDWASLTGHKTPITNSSPMLEPGKTPVMITAYNCLTWLAVVDTDKREGVWLP